MTPDEVSILYGAAVGAGLVAMFSVLILGVLRWWASR